MLMESLRSSRCSRLLAAAHECLRCGCHRDGRNRSSPHIFEGWREYESHNVPDLSAGATWATCKGFSWKQRTWLTYLRDCHGDAHCLVEFCSARNYNLHTRSSPAAKS